MNRSSLYHRNISNTSASLKLYQAKRRKQLKQENARLKRLVGELNLPLFDVPLSQRIMRLS